MSYCRFGWQGSDVYVFESASGLECCGCKLSNNFTTSEPEEMIKHLGQHRRAGHYVPPEAILALFEDIPGAQRPTKPEPVGLTIASLIYTAAVIQQRIDQLRALKKTNAAGP